MLRLTFVVLYTALVIGANPAAADVAAAKGVRAGDMKKMVFHASPKPTPAIDVYGMDDAPHSLSLHRGKWVVLNFWATWCAPCRHEMPSLDQLQASAIGKDLAVLPVATGRNPPQAITKFWVEAGIINMTPLRDPKSELGRAMGVMGLPVTVILDPEGAEVGRLIGDADWAGPDAATMLTALMAP